MSAHVSGLPDRSGPPLNLRFNMIGDPVPWARAGRNRISGRTFTPAKAARQKTALALACKRAMRDAGRGPVPAGVAVHMAILAYFPLPQSLSPAEHGRRLSNGSYHTQTPDADNIGKLVKDALNKIAYHDDCQVARLTVSKLWTADKMGRTVVDIQAPESPIF